MMFSALGCRAAFAILFSALAALATHADEPAVAAQNRRGGSIAANRCDRVIANQPLHGVQLLAFVGGNGRRFSGGLKRAGRI